MIARAKRCLKLFQTLIDGNLGNVSAGGLISEAAVKENRQLTITEIKIYAVLVTLEGKYYKYLIFKE